MSTIIVQGLLGKYLITQGYSSRAAVLGPLHATLVNSIGPRGTSAANAGPRATSVRSR